MTAVPLHQRCFGMMFQEYAPFDTGMWRRYRLDFGIRKIVGRRRQQPVTQGLDLAELDGLGRRAMASHDLRCRDRLADEIRFILEDLGVTAIFVTHDQTEAFAYADRIAILHQGRLE